MKFVTGVYNTKTGSFDDYTIDDFISALSNLQNYGYEEMEADLKAYCQHQDISFDQLMQFSLSDHGTSKSYNLFNRSETDRSSGWAIMDKNFFRSSADQKLKDLRRLMGYHVAPNGQVRTGLANRPMTKHVNCYVDKLRIFDFFVNNPSNEFYDPSIPNDHVVIQFHNYITSSGRAKDIYRNQNVDTFFKVTKIHRDFVNGKIQFKYEGYLDVDKHLSYVLDHFQANKMREIVFSNQNSLGHAHYDPRKLVYLLGPEQRFATGIIDKLKLMLTYKAGRARPHDLRNSITKALLRDARELDGDDNRKIQTISRVKIIPFNSIKQINEKPITLNTGIESDKLSSYYSGSHFFNWFDKSYKSKSWSDAFSSTNNASVDQYKDTIDSFGLDLTFISEKTMVDGVYCIDHDAFKQFLCEHSLYKDIIHKSMKNGKPYSNILSHVFMRHKSEPEASFEEVVSIAEVKDKMKESPLEYMTACKKWNQRKKTIVADKFAVSYKNNSNFVTIGEEDQLTYRRDIIALSYAEDQYFKQDKFHINALVGYFEGEFETPNMDLETYMNLSPEELLTFHQKLGGVSCDGWFTENLLHDTEIIAPRTISLDCKTYEESEILIDYIKHLDDLMNGRGSDPIVLEVNGNYKDKQFMAYYTARCSECDNRMTEKDDYRDAPKMDSLKRFIGHIRPTTEAFYCPICEHVEQNRAIGSVMNEGDVSYNSRSIVQKHYFNGGHGKFNKIVIKSYKRHEDGLDLKVDMYYDLANARVTGPDVVKFVLQERSNSFIGKVKELRVVNPENPSESRVFKDVQLDGLITGGANKAKLVGIMNSQLRLNALVWGRKRALDNNQIAAPSSRFIHDDGSDTDLPFQAENVYYPNKYVTVDEPDFELTEINEKIMKHCQKCEVEREVWNPELRKWETKISVMWVGMTAINATEVSQENNTSYTVDMPRKFSLNDSDHLHQLGFNDLIENLYQQNRRSYFSGFTKNTKTAEIESELLKILGCLTNPMGNDVDSYSENDEKYFDYIKDILEMRKAAGDQKVGNLELRDFSQDRKNRIALTNYVDYSDYLLLSKTHPMFNNKKFVDGNYGMFVFSKYVDIYSKEMVRTERQEFQYCIRFPSYQLMSSLVDLTANGLKVRFNDIFTAFISLFETISTSNVPTQFMVGKKSQPLVGPNGGFIGVSAIDELKKAILNYFLTKEGSFTTNLSLNLPAIASKQTACELLPEDVIVIGDDNDYKRVVSEVLIGLYPDLEVDWRKRYGNDLYDHLAHSWTDEVYGIAHRDPAVWRYQNFMCRIWSKHKANIEFMKMYGKSYEDFLPGCNSMVMNSVRMVADQESDVDGDILTAGLPYIADVVPYMKEYIEEAANNGFFRTQEYYDRKIEEIKSQPVVDEKKLYRYEGYKLFSPMASSVRFGYIMDETESLYIKHPDSLRYSLIKSRVSLEREKVALLESVESKGDIGPLTNSMRKTNYTIDYICDDMKHSHQKYKFYISREDEIGLSFIFQYLLLQRNGVRAVKADGSFGKLTLDAIIKNDPVRTLTDNEPVDIPARELYFKLLKEFDEEYGTDMSRFYNVTIDICDKFMISDTPGFGGGYIRVKSNKTGKESIKLDPSGLNISPRFKDFLGMWHLISGSSHDSFVRRFGEDALFAGIYNNTLAHIPMLRQVGKDLEVLVKEE